jgi:hypothetical protein
VPRPRVSPTLSAPRRSALMYRSAKQPDPPGTKRIKVAKLTMVVYASNDIVSDHIKGDTHQWESQVRHHAPACHGQWQRGDRLGPAGASVRRARRNRLGSHAPARKHAARRRPPCAAAGPGCPWVACRTPKTAVKLVGALRGTATSLPLAQGTLPHGTLTRVSTRHAPRFAGNQGDDGGPALPRPCQPP